MEHCQEEIRENERKIQLLESKLEFLNGKRVDDEQYLSLRNISFSKFQDAKSKGAALYGEKLREQVSTGSQIEFFSNFTEIDTNIKRKIRLLIEENEDLQQDIVYCKGEVRRIEQEEKEEAERQRQLAAQA